MTDSNTLRVGWAFCGSYCTFAAAFESLERFLAESSAVVTPIFSENAARTDTRFGVAADHIARAEALCGKAAITTIAAAEPIGPRALFDLVIIAPCTGNTLAKLATGVTDTAVTMAAKAHLRNSRPVLIAVSTNDALSVAARNIGELMSRRNIYFVPFGQDDAHGKPRSCVADFSRLADAARAALTGGQLQPMLVAPR